jgi:rhomboid protease GluP
MVKQGAYATLLTSAFLHLGIVHLLVNMYALGVMGKVIERLIGTVRFGVVYFTSAITGSLLSLMIHPDVLSVGASGAIFGIAGAMLALGERRAVVMPKNMTGIVLFLVYNLIYGLSNPGINVVAHIGGALGGAAVAGFLVPHQDTSRQRKWAVAGGISLVIFTFLAHLAFLVALGLSMERRGSQSGSSAVSRTGDDTSSLLNEGPTDKRVLARGPELCYRYPSGAGLAIAGGFSQGRTEEMPLACKRSTHSSRVLHIKVFCLT